MAKYFKFTTPKAVAYTAKGFEPNSVTFDFQTKQMHVAYDEVDVVDSVVTVVGADKVLSFTTAELLGLFTPAQLTLLRDKAVQGVIDRTGDTGADEG